MTTENLVLTESFVLVGAIPITVALEEGKVAELRSAPSLPAPTDDVQRLVRGTDREWRQFNTGTNNIYAKNPANAGRTVVSFGE